MSKTHADLVDVATRAAWNVLRLEKGRGRNQHAAAVPRHKVEVAKAKAWGAVQSADPTVGTSHHASATHSHHIGSIVDEGYKAAFKLWEADWLVGQAGGRRAR